MKLQKPTFPLTALKSVLLFLLISIVATSCGDSNDDIDSPEDNVVCENLQLATSQAQEALQNATTSDYESLCMAYQAALNLQIQECGDEDGVLQAIINGLEDCTQVVEPPVSSAEFYITGLFNGEPIVMQTGTSANYYLGCTSGYSINGNPGDNIIRGYGALLSSITLFNESPAGNVLFDYFYEGPYASPLQGTFDPAFNTSFPIGDYNHSEQTVLEAGMRFEFYTKGIDSSASIYYTSEEGDQTNSSFTITGSVSDNYSQFGQTYYRQTITGTFNCMLYSSDGDPIEVTNGTFRVRVVDDCL